MRGPAAPKDPVEKRPCLYVVLDKTISGSKDPEGVIRDYVYLEGRLKVNPSDSRGRGRRIA